MKKPNSLATLEATQLASAILALRHQVEAVNRFNGWRDSEGSKAERVALIHSEASELLEWSRMIDGNGDMPQSDHIEAPGESEELADIVIRAVDYADVYGLDLADAIIKKLEFNRHRGFRHGGKAI